MTSVALIALAICLLTCLEEALGKPSVTLTSDGPVVLDATITFTAQVENSEDYDPPYYFSWSDDASPGHWSEESVDAKVAHWNVTYASKYKYEERIYKTTVRVYYQGIFGRDKIAENTVEYKVTKNLNGRLVYRQATPHHGSIIRSTENTELSVEFHDPSGFLDDAALQFYWFVNDTNYGPSENNSFHFKFFPPGHYTVETIVMAQVSGDERSQPMLSSSDDDIRALSSSEIQGKAPPQVKTGVFRSSIEARTPVTEFNFTGSPWVTAGTMLELKLHCDGSGPWHACWQVKPVPYNMTGNETCPDSEKFIMTSECSFPIYWYFRGHGMHNLMAIVENGVSNKTLMILANIYDTPVQPPISVVVVPITCTLIGLVAVSMGLATFYTYVARKRVSVETADFDFNSPEEQLEYKTFWERLRDSMLNAFNKDNDDVSSHVSSVSSRSIQHPITSIHYGSIS